MEVVEKAGDPLPKRLNEVREKRRILESGLVVKPLTEEEGYDISNAAQSIISDQVLTEVIQKLQVDSLNVESDEFRAEVASRLPIEVPVSNNDFYHAFALKYFIAVQSLEKEVWQNLVQETVSEIDVNQPSTPLQAAVLSLVQFADYEGGAISSQELFLELGKHAQVYEHLLREKLGSSFNYSDYYDLVSAHFPVLLKRLIGIDSVILDGYRRNAPEQDRSDDARLVLYLSDPLDERFYYLDENNGLRIKQDFIQLLKDMAKKHQINSDTLGRTENRGCPFLATNVRDEFIKFAIEELIRHHKVCVGRN